MQMPLVKFRLIPIMEEFWRSHEWQLIFISMGQDGCFFTVAPN